MSNISKRIIYFGNERLATGVQTDASILRALLEAGYDVAAVVSHYEHGKSRNVRDLEIKHVTTEHGIPLLLPDTLSDITEQLHHYGAEAGVLVAYGKLVPQSIIDLFPKGIVNIHPSMLPKHRGPTPIESVILNGESTTGVSLMRLAKAMDAGPIYAQSDIELSGQETKQELAKVLSDIGRAMLLETLPGILEGTIVALPQDDRFATYDNLLTKDMSTIDWHRTASQIEREIRALAGWPQSRTELAGVPVIITKAAVAHQKLQPGEVAAQNRNLIVGCGEDSVLIERLKPTGKAEMTAEAFLAGYGSRL